MSRAALDEVLSWYMTARRLLEGILGGLVSDPESLLRLIWPEDWQLQPVDEVRDHLAKTIRELDDYTVVALFGAFEEWLKENAAERGIRSHRIARLLSYYREKSIVDSRHVTNVEGVKNYRDWVAHGRRWPRPPSVVPILAHEHLSEFIRCAELTQEER